VFERCAYDISCDYCSGRRACRALSGIDAIYCINIQENPKRFADAQKLFHFQGLCRDVIFYRPTRGRHSSLAIWTSHREVAREALRRGQQRVLVLEDDLRFLRGWVSILDAIRRALSRLPSGWFGLYLGHSALQGYFVAWGVMRVSSSTTHAYIANRPLLDWLDATEPMDPYTPIRSRLIGRGIDAAFACLPGMYALFPMKIMQRRVEEARTDDHMGPRALWDPQRYRLFILIEGMWAKQWIAAIVSPLHWVIMRFAKRRFTLPLEVQMEVRRLFDENYYLSRYPDAAASGRHALEHFLACGNGEGRNPNPWFDTKWYLGKYKEAKKTRLTAFEHFLWRGRFAGYRANSGEQSEVRTSSQ
jgi:GR25 family glycosyltransferase involved in LPS biosynthesis